jgi:hypothetical protein
MTAAAAPGSTVESRAAALAMFEGQVPCLFQLAEPSCPDTAAWLAWFAHEENTASCSSNEPWLLCEAHKKMVQTTSHPFWRTWHQTPPLICEPCGTPLRLDRFEPL